MISATRKPIRDSYKPMNGSDSGVFDYSAATSHRTPTTRDSGFYGDSVATTTVSSHFGRRQPSDADQTTIHGADDSISRSTFKYDTEIISNDQFNQQQQPRNIRRQIRSSVPSNYETISDFHSGISSQRKVPITTQSRSKPLVVDEIETIETETRVECQVQRTNEIKESTTKTEPSGTLTAPRKTITTTTTTTTTTGAPIVQSPETSSDETMRMTTSPKRILPNERSSSYGPTKSNSKRFSIKSLIY